MPTTKKFFFHLIVHIYNFKLHGFTVASRIYNRLKNHPDITNFTIPIVILACKIANERIIIEDVIKKIKEGIHNKGWKCNRGCKEKDLKFNIKQNHKLLDPFFIIDQEVRLLTLLNFNPHFPNFYYLFSYKLYSITDKKQIFKNLFCLITDFFYFIDDYDDIDHNDFFASLTYFSIVLDENPSILLSKNHTIYLNTLLEGFDYNEQNVYSIVKKLVDYYEKMYNQN